MLYKITAKEPITGSGWGLNWVDGTATTANHAISEKLAGKGYSVEELPDAMPAADPVDLDISKWSVAKLKTFAADNGINIGTATKKEDVLAAIAAASNPEPDPE